MASSSIPMPAIQRLIGRENFTTWKFAMQTYLEHEELWECVTGTEKDEKKNTKAKAKIILSIETVNYVHVESAKNAKEAWDNLTKAFEDSGLTRKVGLLRSLITTQLENCISIEDYVNKIITNSHKLTNIGLKVDDVWIGTLLLAGLPERYRPMIMALESSGTPISSDAIKVKLLQEIKEHSGVSVQNDSALYGKTGPSFSKQSSKGIRCYECNRLGHLAKDCFRRNPRSKTNYSKKFVPKTLLSVMSTGNVNEEDWYIDSGASVHITNKESDLVEVRRPTSQKIILADNSTMPINVMGNVEVELNTKGIIDTVQIEDVMHVPKATTNLLSVSKITSKGNKVVFNSKECKVYNANHKLIASASNVEGMYKLNRNVPKVNLISSSKNYDLWHNRFGHPCKDVMRLINKKGVLRTNVQIPEAVQCDICVKGKQSRLPFKRESKSTRNVLELVHSDLCGPIEERSLGGSRYILTFIDDHSRKIFIYLLKSKDQVYTKFVEFKNYVENQTDKKIKILRSDNGTEYINARLKDYLRQAGIKHEMTIPYNPEQNGLAERANRKIIEKVRCLLIGANLDKRFWAEAANTAVHLINRTPSRVVNNQIPEEIWTGRKLNLNYLKIFGSKAMAHIPVERRRKLDSKSEECIHVGYATNSKGYRLYNLKSKKVIEGRNVTFFEGQFPKTEESNFQESNTFQEVRNTISLDLIVEQDKDKEKLIENNEDAENINQQGTEEPIDDTIVAADTNQENEDVLSEDNKDSSSSDEYEEADINIQPPVETPRRSSRPPKPKIYKDYYNLNVTTANESPLTVDEALTNEEASEWQSAMTEEYKSLIENDTWKLVDLPKNKNTIKTKWVFKKKMNLEGSVTRYKARLVAKGCSQRRGADYEETFAPVARYNSIRLILGLGVKYDMDMEHMDAVSAFLQGELKETLYIEQPEGFVKKGQEGKVCKLNKAIYGLKQAGRAWNQKLHTTLINIGLIQSRYDQCVYYKINNNKLTILAVYVDDLIIISNDNSFKACVKSELIKVFKMKYLGELKQFLGIGINRDRANGKLWLNQEHYIEEILEKFNMKGCNSANTPLDHNQKLTKNEVSNTEGSDDHMDSVPYQNAIGSLIYVAQATRPDITHAVSYLSRFNTNPNKSHWTAVKRIFRYLSKTKDYRLEYTKNVKSSLVGYADADWANDLEDRRSVTGYIFLFQNCPISWLSRRQPTIALSTAEAEYMSMSTAVQEAKWLRGILSELEPCESNRVTLYCDNKSAIDLAKTENYKARTKHIDVKHHFVRENVKNNVIKIEHVSSGEMIADILTKALPPVIHGRHLENLNIKNL